MKILAFDTSCSTGSVAVCENKEVLAETFLRSELTHSATLMPMIEQTLLKSGLSLKQIEGIAVTVGPGSFTGVRIGVSTAKGIADGLGISCYPVSSLLALAYGLKDHNGLVCPAFDARCEQVYTALFQAKDGKIIRLTEDRPMPAPGLMNELNSMEQPVLFAGDGAEICMKSAEETGLVNAGICNDDVRYIKAGAIAAALVDENIQPVLPKEIQPVYLRLSQAERQRNERNVKNK